MPMRRMKKEKRKKKSYFQFLRFFISSNEHVVSQFLSYCSLIRNLLTENLADLIS